LQVAVLAGEMKLEFDPQADAVYLELTEAEVEESKEI